MVLKDIEFFTYEHEVWVREHDGNTHKLVETDYDFMRAMVDYIYTFYPKAYKALAEEYKAISFNMPFYRYRIVCRFVRCNFAQLDRTPDIDGDMHSTFEYIQCPLRGECKHENVICRPEFDHRLSPAETRVMRLVYEGMNESEIADRLCLSQHTVHTHIHNAYSRLGLHGKSEFIKYASTNGIFA